MRNYFCHWYLAKTEIVDLIFLTESYNCKTLQSVEVFITQFIKDNICRNIYFRKLFVVLIQ